MISVSSSLGDVSAGKCQGLLQGRHILIADDSALMRFVAASTLRREGAIVEEVPDGTTALKAITAGMPELILMDVQMPGMSGTEVAHIIREKGYILPIIALTAEGADLDDTAAMSGINETIRKPFTQALLLQKVATYLDCLGVRPCDDAAMRQAAEEPAIDLGPLRALCGGDPVFINRMLGIAVQELPFAADQMRNAYNGQYWEELARVAHRVRPCVQGMGMSELADKLRHIETLAKGNVNGSLLSQLINHAAGRMEAVARQIIREQ